MTLYRIPARMVEFLEGSGMAGEVPEDTTDDDQRLLLRFRRTAPYRDGAWRMKLSESEREILAEWAGYLAEASGDSAGCEPDALADLNAARATIRQMRKT